MHDRESMNAKSVKTVCSYCGVGCGIRVESRAGAGLRLEGDPDHPANRGLLCSKGRYLHYTAMDRTQRLLHPMMRANRAAPLEQVSWDAALQRAAAVFGSIIRRHGPRSVGMYVSGQMLTEEYYLANKLVKGFFGCNNIDTNSRLCMSSAVSAYKLALGDDLVPSSYEDIDHADCFLIAGANPAWCHPILFRRIEARKQASPQTKIIVVDPRRTESCELADLHLQIHPGTDVTLFHAIARELFEKHWIDEEFIREHTEGIAELRERAMEIATDETARRCRIPAAQIRQAAALIGRAKGFMSMWAMGLNQSRVGVDKNLALMNLNLITGQIGKRGAGPFSLTGQPNAMGGRETGGLSTLLAAHHDLANPAHRRKVAQHWGAPSIDEQPGLTATEMFDALEDDRLKAIWIVCTNPAVSMPNLKRIERALKRARFVIVQDVSAQSDTLEFADLVLPAAGWLEKDGTMTNSERRVSHLPKLLDPPGEALPDAEIFMRFAKAFGQGAAFRYQNSAEVFDDFAKLTRGTAIDMAGISHARLRKEGSLQWPCPSAVHPGTPRLFEDHRFATPSGRARLHAPDGGAPEPIPPRFPLILTTGRVRDQWHTMTRTGLVRRLGRHAPSPFLEIHPDDAARAGIEDGGAVLIASEAGEIRTHARIVETIKPGVVFLPMHWGKRLGRGAARANNATTGAVDPVSGEPDFKLTPVRVERLEEAAQRIVIVGAGAASLECVRELRRRGRADEVTILCAEPDPFYNRVLLPDLISGAKPWQALATCSAGELAELNVRVIAGRRAARIDRDAREAIDQNGERYAYDKLVIAAGSRPRPLECAPAGMSGIYSLRTRGDAERIAALASPGAEAVVSGGGLLGLEAAAALKQRGMRVTVLQRSDRLMRQQLDSDAAEILAEQLAALDIDVILNDSIALVQGEGRVQRVRTQAGRRLHCDLLLVAAGILPNAEIGREAGLAGVRGIAVDERMQTSDPRIFAIGEVAELEGASCGTTPAAQAQGRAAAAAIAGDPLVHCEPPVEFNVLKIPGIRLASAGLTQPSPAELAEGGFEEVRLVDRARQYYKKCVLRHGRLVGAILIGDLTELGAWRELIESGIELEELRETLLRPGAAAADACEGELICSCRNVGAENLRKQIAAGCASFEALLDCTKAGTGCGSCRSEARRIWDDAAQSAADETLKESVG